MMQSGIVHHDQLQHTQQDQASFDAFLSDNVKDERGAPVDLSGSSFAPIAAQQLPGGTAAGSNFQEGSYGTNGSPHVVSWWRRMLSCFIIENYRPYFDVDTVDVQGRLYGSLRFFNEQNAFWDKVLVSGYYSSETTIDENMADDENAADEASSSQSHNGGRSLNITTGTGGSGDRVKGPDVYGPFWIATTLIFVVAVTSNLSMYMNRPRGEEYREDFEYDVYLLVHAIWIIYSFTFGVPLFLSLGFYCLFPKTNAISASSEDLNNNPSFVDMVCLYGYSMVPFIFASFLGGIIPFSPIQWILLIGATGVSLVLVLRNMVGFVMGSSGGALQQTENGVRQELAFLHGMRAKGGPILGTIIGCHVLFLVVLKLGFYSHHITK